MVLLLHRVFNRPLPCSSTPNCLWPGLGTRRGRARHSGRAGVVNQNASVGKRRRAKDCPPYLPQRRPGGRFRRRARPKRQRAGALQDAARGSGGHRSTRQRVLDCGGKRSATPLSPARKPFASRMFLVRPKAPSPLRSAGALPIHPPQTAIDRTPGTLLGSALASSHQVRRAGWRVGYFTPATGLAGRLPPLVSRFCSRSAAVTVDTTPAAGTGTLATHRMPFRTSLRWLASAQLR